MTQPETQSSLGYVIKRIEALEKLQDEIHGATMKFLGQIEAKNAEWLLKFVALQKQADDRHKAYGVMFVNLQKQIELLTIKTRNSISGLGDNQSKLWKSRK